jgi:hypothetical protein
MEKEQDKTDLQLFPCSFCAKETPLSSMTEHHKQCEMAFECDLCQDYYPIYILDDHNYQCTKQFVKKKAEIFKGAIKLG